MSKEMLVIALGVFIVLLRTMLALPGSWQTALLVLSGITLAVVGFLLRGEALSRANSPRREARAESYPFVEAAPEHAHETREGITSLN